MCNALRAFQAFKRRYCSWRGLLQPIANAAENSGGIAALVSVDHAVPDRPLHCCVRQPRGIAGLDHRPWPSAILRLTGVGRRLRRRICMRVRSERQRPSDRKRRRGGRFCLRCCCRCVMRELISDWRGGRCGIRLCRGCFGSRGRGVGFS